jgi:poly(3-hydroxybutyrate) depolymerase
VGSLAALLVALVGAAGLVAAAASTSAVARSTLGRVAASKLASSSNACTRGQAALPGVQCRSIVSDGVKRYFVEHVPLGMSAGAMAPLVILYHWSGQSAANFELVSGFDAVADQQHYVAVYLDGWHLGGTEHPYTYWRIGSTLSKPGDVNVNADDDIDLTADVIADLSENQRLVDPAQVYAYGRSAGAFFAHRLACEAGPLFRAVIGFSGTQMGPCDSAEPVSVEEIVATGDEFINGYTFADGETVAPVADYIVGEGSTTTSWAQRMHCTTESSFGRTLGTTQIVFALWSGCDNGRTAELGYYVGAHNQIASPSANAIVVDAITAARAAPATPISWFVSSCNVRTCQLTSRAYDPSGTITTSVWDFGDGVLAVGDAVTHTWSSIGRWPVQLIIVDDQLHAVKVTRMTAVTVPGMPAAPHAVPGSHSATITWFAPADDGGAPVTGYVVTPYLAGVAQAPVSFASAATTETVTGLGSGESYTFTVRATNANGTGDESWSTTAITPL